MRAELYIAVAQAVFVYANLGKTTVYPFGLPSSDLLHLPNITFKDISPAPQLCLDQAEDFKCVVENVEARLVAFDDCQIPWVLCRCDDANMSLDDMSVKFGKVPPGIRSYVGGALAVHAARPSAGSAGDFIVFQGNTSTSVFVHESSHSLDKGTSISDGWQEVIDDSTCVPDPYANASPAEDFAQVSVLFTHKEHIGPLLPNSTCLNAQLGVFNNTDRLRDATNAPTCTPSKRPFLLSNETIAPDIPQDQPVSNTITASYGALGIMVFELDSNNTIRVASAPRKSMFYAPITTYPVDLLQ